MQMKSQENLVTNNHKILFILSGSGINRAYQISAYEKCIVLFYKQINNDYLLAIPHRTLADRNDR